MGIDTVGGKADLLVLVEAIGEGVLTLNGEGIILTCNSRFAQMSDVPQEQIMGAHWHKFFPTDEHPALDGLLEKAKVANQEFFTLQKADGSLLPVELTLRSLEKEQAEAFLVLVTDIRRAKEMKEAQRLAHIGNWEWLPDQDTSIWSEEVFNIYGLNPTQSALNYKQVQDHLTPESWARLNGLMLQALQTGAPFEVDLEVLRPDGTHRWITNRIEPSEKDHSGKVKKMRGTVQDITELRMAEELIRNSEHTTRQTIDALIAHVCLLDATGKIIDTNRAWKDFALANGAHATFEGVNYLAVCDAVSGPERPDALAIAAGIRSVIKGDQEKFTLEYACHSPDQKRWFNARVSRCSDTTAARVVIAHESITETKRAEEALRQSEERFRNIFSTAVVGLSTADLKGHFLEVNPVFALITGYTNEELLTRDFQSITHPDDRAWNMELFRQLVEGRIPNFVIQKRYVKKGGEIVWAQISTSLCRDAQGRPAHTVAIVEDITERKQAEDSLREAKEYAENLIQSANVLIIEVDPRGKILVFNRVAEKISGYSSAEIAGRNWFETLVPGDRYPELRDELLRLMATQEEPWDHENCILTKNGEERMISWRNNLVRQEGRTIGTISFGIDITDRQRMEESLRRSEERFRTMAEAVPEMIFTCQPDGSIDYFNGAFYRYTGLSLGSATGHAWLDLIHPEDRESIKARMTQSMRIGQTFECQFRLRNANGDYRWFLSRKRPIYDKQGEIVQWQGVITEIEEQKKVEERLADQVAQRTAKLAETVTELEQYSYSITHDLRAPLRAIEGFVELLKEDCSGTLSATSQDYLENITKASERMENLIRDSLNYGKILQTELKLEPIDFKTLVLEVIKTYPALQALRADVALEGEFPPILGNDAALAQCVSNLLLNAVKFVTPGTFPRVRVSAELKNDWVRLWFEDNGIGIPKEVQDRIFGMFQQLDKSYEGTGIGLAIVRKAVERMGGRAGVESHPGMGSRFWLDLKRAD